MAFSDPTQPIATCSATSCVDCPVSAKVQCHFRAKDLIHFLLISFPGVIIGGAVIFAFNQWLTAVYLAIIVGFFGFLEIRVMCSHCPHYAEDGLTLSCWANHGSLKLWKYRPGPMTKSEKYLFFAGLVVIGILPLPFFLLTGAWLLLLLYILTTAAFYMTLKFFLCSKCMNFACPLNGVDQGGRELFFKRNPSVAEHWINDKLNKDNSIQNIRKSR